MRSMKVSRNESDSDKNVFVHSAVIGWCYNPLTCLYGTCCPCCAVASAKTMFDGSDWCFNCVCFGANPCIVRNYVRMGYEIDGRAGYSDCFCPCVCCPCAVTQLLNEVTYRGPKIYSTKKAGSTPGTSWMAERSTSSLCGDVPDFLCTFLTCNCESANVFSQLSGVPFWFALCFSNICQTQV
jgi:Cys-rich protein (TIGR01571 family)